MATKLTQVFKKAMFKILHKLQFWQILFCSIKLKKKIKFLTHFQHKYNKKSYKNAKNQNSKKDNVLNR